MKIKSRNYIKFAIMSMLVFGLLITIEAANPAAGDPEIVVTSGDWEYIDYGAEIAIRYYIGSETDVVIPRTIDGKLVVELTCRPYKGLGPIYLPVVSPMFLYPEHVESVTIPDSVTSIGPIVFDGCVNLASITIPDGVTEIGDLAFQCCTSLTSIIIPKKVASIGDNAFWGCGNLKDVYFASSKPPVMGESVFDYVKEGARNSSKKSQRIWQRGFSLERLDCQL